MKTLLSILIFTLFSCTQYVYELDVPKDSYYLYQLQGGESALLGESGFPYYFVLTDGIIYNKGVEVGQYNISGKMALMVLQVDGSVFINTFEIIRTLDGRMNYLYSVDLMFVYATLDQMGINKILNKWKH